MQGGGGGGGSVLLCLAFLVVAADPPTDAQSDATRAAAAATAATWRSFFFFFFFCCNKSVAIVVVSNNPTSKQRSKEAMKQASRKRETVAWRTQPISQTNKQKQSPKSKTQKPIKAKRSCHAHPYTFARYLYPLGTLGYLLIFEYTPSTHHPLAASITSFFFAFLKFRQNARIK
jgi:hypothetical protein